MASTTLDPPVRETAANRSGSTGANEWLVGPGFDLFCLANVAWPLLLLVPWDSTVGGRERLLFWQVYFVTTPHRWVTLPIVFTDRARFRERRGLFLGLAAIVTAICVGVRLSTGALTCLLTIDYLWNAWHFAAQHHGIYRIYGRLGGVPQPRWASAEKWGLRIFLLYVTLRIAGMTWGRPDWEQWLARLDWVAPLAPLALLGADFARRPRVAAGRICYLLSLSTLYLGLLWAVHTQRPALVLTLATASALFHAIEYLALVGWSVQRRSAQLGDQLGWLAWLAPRWGLTLGLSMIGLGSIGWWMDQTYLDLWLFINVIVAFLHYAYDGLIWRSSRVTSRALSQAAPIAPPPFVPEPA